ncbi:unnamed protein product [Symbiodinium microadriaticum]|nr:unnamed protein product [Symbiodinium microadriaticum]CAE7753190.1 unnamed protein product [Symbiodinium sp. KB8]
MDPEHPKPCLQLIWTAGTKRCRVASQTPCSQRDCPFNLFEEVHVCSCVVRQCVKLTTEKLGKRTMAAVAVLGLVLLGRSALAQNCPTFPAQKEAIGAAMTCGVACQLMDLSVADLCRFDTSACGDSVPAGTSCQIACRDPFFGQTSLASCPPGNTNPATRAAWTPPDCDIFASACPEPPEIPAAYVKEQDGQWKCAPGFAGTAVARCVPDENCENTLQFFGCEETTACAPPTELIGCVLDVTQCADVEPGGACPVSCRFPYTGWSSVAVCHPDNTNPDVGLLVVQPECTLTCEDPPNEPQGYIKVSSGNGWACAPGYGGTATWECVIDSVCASKKVLSGCSLLARCILPEDEDACMYDFTECIGETAAPGSSCKVHCKRPYEGNSTTASCPAGNTNPIRQLDWEPPDCNINCGQVADVPVGYLSHPYRREFGGWRCVDGYAGFPVVTCGTDVNCNPQLKFAGCSALIPCVQPNLSAGELCAFQHTCISVRSGGSCEVSCRPPYVGGIASAVCPGNNTQNGRQLIWAAPDCNLECPIPDPVRDGYVVTGVDVLGKPTFACAPRWEGTPTATCRISDSGCNAAYELQGCTPQAACAIPTDAPCSVDWSDCQNVFAGESCSVSCGPSFSGNITEATCAEGNTDPTTLLEWTFPGCQLSCQDPVAPIGYSKTLFMCATNYSGDPVSRCAADWDDACRSTYSFSGCRELVPCAPPRVGRGRGARSESSDAQQMLCQYDFSDCQSVLPGHNCTIRCGTDYSGTSTIAYCPSDNTDPNAELLYVEPLCRLNPCEMNVPPGYVETPCGWVCDDGYIGSVQASCEPVGNEPGRCRSVLQISGCTQTVQCAPLIVNDTCRTNASECTSLQPGQGCNVTCSEPYTGGQGENATWAYCPLGTTTPNQQPVWGTDMEEWALDCEIECELPRPIPAGYLLSTDGEWSCDRANQYSGVASAECTVNVSTCLPILVLSGCFPTTPCDMPAYDRCQHDVSGCPVDGKLISGTSCSVSCMSPYSTPLGEAGGLIECRDPNIDALGAIWTPPRCILGCAQPSSQAGYRQVLGEWTCADGYDGPGAIWFECVVEPDSCVAFPRLFGCMPFVACTTPALTPVQQCVLDLVNGNCLSVLPGETCTIYCKFPYVGDRIFAACPATNIDAAREPNWAAPICYCPIPDPVPTGYVYLGPDEFGCADGFFGAAVYRCDVDTSTCQPTVVLTGCYPLSSCSTPQVDTYNLCKVDFSECIGPIAPGDSCNVTCKAGYGENMSVAECPGDNTDPDYMPALLLECGEYTCATPEEWAMENPLPKGYDVGVWRCARGYRGVTSTQCLQSDECGGTLQLFGCVPLESCSSPRLSARDACRFNFTDCEDTPAGGFCEIQCAEPFFGLPGKAFCRPDTTDPSTELTWAEPLCHLRCPDPDPIPAGFQRVGSCGWECAEGYEGKPIADCDVDEFCQPRLILSGCLREEPCMIPREGSYDQCKFNFTDCMGQILMPGASCQVKCRPPYLGADFVATCPEFNTVPGLTLVFSESSCMLNCPVPDPVPMGYSVSQGNDWSCDEGFSGTPLASCVLNEECQEPRLQLTGCYQNTPCRAPHLEVCRFETDCRESVQPGEECEVRCLPPFSFNSSLARCPDLNTEANRTPDWEEPDCEPLCPPMDPPANYTLEQGVLMCVADAVGQPMAECRINQTNCQAYWHYAGCHLLTPCAVPAIDACRMDIGNCTEVLPGEWCEMRCRDGLVGGEFMGSCPSDNVDSTTPLAFDRPPSCHCPVAAPQLGYRPNHSHGHGHSHSNVDGGRWQCAEDWTGTAEATCVIDDGCNIQVTLSGCVPIHSCAPPLPMYLSHPDDCRRVPAGSTCAARCAPFACVSGGPVTVECPAANRDPTLPAELLEGSCSVRCEICRSTPFLDSDPRPGHIAGMLRFGEAHANGQMPVEGVFGYRVFFADGCGMQVGPTLGYVPRSERLYACCAATAYSLEVSDAEIPQGAAQLLIAINTSFGEMPHGTSIEYSDLSQTVVETTPRVITADSRRALLHPGGIWLMLIASLLHLSL